MRSLGPPRRRPSLLTRLAERRVLVVGAAVLLVVTAVVAISAATPVGRERVSRRSHTMTPSFDDQGPGGDQPWLVALPLVSGAAPRT